MDDDDDGGGGGWNQHSARPSSPSANRRLYCDGCGGRDFYLDDDGYYYCTQCGSQSQDLIHTQTADEDLLADGALYNIRHTRTLLSQELDRTLGGPPAAKQENEDCFGVGYDGLSEPRDFGSGSVSDREELVDVIRFRYVKGLQVMVQRQCEVLVERFGVSAYVVGIVGSVWLRYVAAMRVLADDWPEKAIEESEVAAEAAGLTRVGEEEKPKKFKRIRPKYRSEPHNAYGQRAIFIWLRSLRRMVPLHSTLAISFLVCHIAREPILPTDILNWVSEGKLPFLAAFTEMDRRLEKPSSPCPLSSRALFRPIQVIGAEQLEATAASIAQAIGLRLPSVNFYAIAHRYLKELSLPVEKILPHACRIYEWSLPVDLWLSSKVSGFPTRACVMSILIVAMRLLYNIQGQGMWEMSHSKVRNSRPNDQKPEKKLLHVQASDYNCQELFSILEATYDKINTTHDYLQDLPSYLKHCRDVIFAGATKSYEEDKLIKRLWDMYEKEEDDGEEVKRPRHRASTNDTWHPKKHEEDNMGIETQMDEDITAENNLTKPLNRNIEKHEEDNPGTETQINEDTTTENNPTKHLDHTIEKIKLEMEENGFEYLPPKAHPKIAYIHYRRQKIDGKLVCVCHSDYYVLLRACAKLVEVDAQTMHRCVLSLERRLEWIDKRIDEVVCHQDSGS